MSDEVKAPLSTSEYNTVGQLLLELLASYPNFPETIDDSKIYYQSRATTECIALYTLEGAKYLKKNVQGGFTAQIPFQIAYLSFPTTNKARIDAQSVVDGIAAWLEDVDNLPALSDNRTITDITASTTVAFEDEASGDNSVVFVSNVTMEYEAE